MRRLLDWYRVDRGYWFVPKMFGFGATPVTWQGWALTLGFAALLAADIRFTHHVGVQVALGIVLAVVFCAIAWAKTEGGWRWRWGPDR
jgi:membrane-bound ClpP family serine protease